MIKGITTVRKIGSAKEFEALKDLFAALGFEPGKGWKDSVSEGASYLAPVGNLELVQGKAAHLTDLWVEVTDKFETDWDARAFIAEPSKGLKIAFWQKNRPKQIAIEGDMNSQGMRFGIVMARWNSFITERLLQG